MSYDTECYRLAATFLSDEGISSIEELNKLTDKLAQEIQNTIEGFLQHDVPQAAKVAINDG